MALLVMASKPMSDATDIDTSAIIPRLPQANSHLPIGTVLHARQQGSPFPWSLSVFVGVQGHGMHGMSLLPYVRLPTVVRWLWPSQGPSIDWLCPSK